jgi:hypothetical protein
LTGRWDCIATADASPNLCQIAVIISALAETSAASKAATGTKASRNDTSFDRRKEYPLSHVKTKRPS